MVDLAVRYAEALLEAAKRENALNLVMDEMQYLAREFSQSEKEFDAPVFTVREQQATVEYVLGNKFHPLTKRFVCLLAEMRRIGSINKITDVFTKLALKETGHIDLYVKIYEEIPPETETKLIEASSVMGIFEAQ